MSHKETSSPLFLCRLLSLVALAIATVALVAPHRAIAASAGAPRAALSPSAKPAPASHTPTLTGIDVLENEDFAPLKGKRIGLITNQTGVDSQGRRTIDVLKSAPGVQLVALFSPEHGIEGRADSKVGNDTDSATGLPIFSLYGATRRPTPEMLANLDALVFDIQDAGVRFYTYTTTMGYCMEEAAKHHVAFYVLDRPEMLGGDVIEGPMLDADKLSFVGYFPMPVRYAMTLGELAQMFNAENKIGADLHVIELKNWKRSEPYSETGAKWISPSPNLRNLTEDYFYPGLEILQAGGVSVGRGTDTPFELVGAPWIDAKAFATALTKRKIAGVEFVEAQFTPAQGLYAGVSCGGAHLTIAPRGELRSMRMGLEIADVLHKMYPDKFQLPKIITLVGSQSTIDALQRGTSPAAIIKSWTPGLDKFRQVRAKYLLYR
jgi:uncharacterized protein YbbC (DUF1343 family)